METTRCDSCGHVHMVTDHDAGEIVCSKCGRVAADKMVHSGAEWRAFAAEESDRARTGVATSIAMHDMGLSTVIGNADRDSTGKPLAASMRGTIARLRAWDGRTQASTSAHRNLRQALTEVDKIRGKLGLTDAVVENAAYLYRKSMEKKLVRGRSIQGLVAACIYAACRHMQTFRTLDDIADSMNIRRKDVARCYRIMCRELDLVMPVVDPVNGVSRIASIAKLSEKSTRKAVSILNKAKEIGLLAGKDPMGVAAAALYLACISTGEIKSQKDISAASGVTEVTIRNRCTGLKKLLTI